MAVIPKLAAAVYRFQLKEFRYPNFTEAFTRSPELGETNFRVSVWPTLYVPRFIRTVSLFSETVVM